MIARGVLAPCSPSWEVPFGFATYEATETIEGPIRYRDGHVEYGRRDYHYGVQHIYDDGSLRIVVRPGSRESYGAPSWCMTIESLAGQPGQQFQTVEGALAAARGELSRWPEYRHALSAARQSGSLS